MAALIEPRDDEPAAGDLRLSRALQVLVVDDDHLFRFAVRTLLETDRRLSVVGEAGDGSEAVEAATELSPDVILMDLDMPGMDGLEAIARLAHRTPSPPVIVLTGSNDPQAVERALRAGAARYIQKSHIADICGLVVAVGRGETNGA
jgi:DNA-binding NarL/FixJ family response regulator